MVTSAAPLDLATKLTRPGDTAPSACAPHASYRRAGATTAVEDAPTPSRTWPSAPR